MRLYEIENCKDLGTYDQKNQTQGFLPFNKMIYRKYIQNLENIIRNLKKDLNDCLNNWLKTIIDIQEYQ